MIRELLKNKIKDISPGLLLKLQKIQAKRRIVKKKLRWHYYKNKLSGKPYWDNEVTDFGSRMSSARGDLLSQAARGCDNALEIGSLVGYSAYMIVKEIKGTLTCIDNWENDSIFKQFKSNIKLSGIKNRLRIMRMTSDEAFKKLARDRFNLICIDGDHRYSQIKKDLENYQTLIEDGGVLCGDDLELTFDQVDQNFNLAHCEKDWIRDPKTGINYHPGITRAVKEVFGEVWSRNGFWAVRKINKKIVKLVLRY